MVRKSLVLILAVVILCSLAHVSLGYSARSIGMGGAFTAVADDGSAAYWNPAGIPQVKFALTGSLGANFIEGYDGDGYYWFDAYIPGYIGLTSQYVAVNCFFDVFSNDVYEDEYAEEPLSNFTKTYNALTGTLAMSVGKVIMIGGNIKWRNFHESWTIGEELVDEYVGEGAVAYDVGVILQPFGNNRLRLGFVARDLNTPQITGEYGETIVTLTPEYEVGIAVKPLKSSLLAADLKFFEQYGEDRMMLKAGLEQKILFGLLALRGGIRMPDLESDEVIYCTGLGLNLGPLFAEVAVDDWVNEENAIVVLTGGIKF